MSIPNWPSIKAPDYNRYRESLIKPARRTEFEGNTISTRPRAGKVRQRFTVGWSKLSDADKETLFTFFSNYQGLAFNFTPPGESTSVLCVFASDEITATAMSCDATGRARWALSVDLYECEDSTILANAAEEIEE